MGLVEARAAWEHLYRAFAAPGRPPMRRADLGDRSGRASAQQPAVREEQAAVGRPVPSAHPHLTRRDRAPRMLVGMVAQVVKMPPGCPIQVRVVPPLRPSVPSPAPRPTIG